MHLNHEIQTRSFRYSKRSDKSHVVRICFIHAKQTIKMQSNLFCNQTLIIKSLNGCLNTVSDPMFTYYKVTCHYLGWHYIFLQWLILDFWNVIHRICLCLFLLTNILAWIPWIFTNIQVKYIICHEIHLCETSCKAWKVNPTQANTY